MDRIGSCDCCADLGGVLLMRSGDPEKIFQHRLMQRCAGCVREFKGEDGRMACTEGKTHGLRCGQYVESAIHRARKIFEGGK